ncbi:MAG: hypothetical protein ABFC84_01555 [Veillonellales bacterium]
MSDANGAGCKSGSREALVADDGGFTGHGRYFIFLRWFDEKFFTQHEISLASFIVYGKFIIGKNKSKPQRAKSEYVGFTKQGYYFAAMTPLGITAPSRKPVAEAGALKQVSKM